MPGFDLVDEPWIPLHLLDGRVEECSLREVFSRANEARAITGELPTVAFALLRLALAVLHRSVDGPRDEFEWESLWQANDLPTAKIERYLDTHRDRFDLLSSTTPFFQVADLRTAKAEAAGLEALIADVPNNIRMFPTRHGAALAAISHAEAARWVVHAQAFEPSGIRGAAVGDPRAKSGKVYPIGTGWAGAIGGVHVEGSTLRETLLLNLVTVPANDLPVWERPPQTADEEVTGGRPVTGPADAYTWQKARIRLFATGDVVTGALVTNGDRAVVANQMAAEPMTVWRLSENQTKAEGIDVYFPAQHRPERQFWRGLSATLPKANLGTATEREKSRPPGVLTWLAALTLEGVLPADRPIRLRAVGMEYGPQNAVVNDLVDDVLTLQLAALSAGHVDVRFAIDDAVTKAGKACWAMGLYAGNLAAAEVGDAAGDAGSARIAAERSSAEAEAYAALDAPFRQWLSQLNPENALQARDAWTGQVRRTVLRMAERLAEAAPPSTFSQRPPTHTMCVPLADRQLRQYLARENILVRRPTP